MPPGSDCVGFLVARGKPLVYRSSHSTRGRGRQGILGRAVLPHAVAVAQDALGQTFGQDHAVAGVEQVAGLMRIGAVAHFHQDAGHARTQQDDEGGRPGAVVAHGIAAALQTGQGLLLDVGGQPAALVLAGREHAVGQDLLDLAQVPVVAGVFLAGHTHGPGIAGDVR